jgi:hypothetical protein
VTARPAGRVDEDGHAAMIAVEEQA